MAKHNLKKGSEMKNREFTAVAATSLSRPDLNGQCFTVGALEQLAEQSKDARVTYNFDPHFIIGKVVSGEIDGDKLIVKFKLTSEFNKFLKAHPEIKLNAPVPYYIVPSYTVIESKQIKECQVHSKVKLANFGLTNKPADTNISPIMGG